MAFNPNNPTASGMVLTFDDEFTTSSISSDGVANNTKWNDHIWFHSPVPGDFSVSNGVMNVLGDPNDPWAANMMTVNSAGQGFTQQYGYFEADIEVPGGQGTWPSFWGFSEKSILGQNVPASEFDILEGQGSAPTYYWSTVHQATNNSGGMSDATNSNATINSGVDLSAGFHRFGMLWDPNSNYITFYLDGKPTIQVPKWSTTDNSAIALILGSGIGDMIGTNQPNGSTPNPADMKVDYVRVYQFASLNPTAVQADPVSTAAGNTDPVALVNALGQGSSTTPAPSQATSGVGTLPAGSSAGSSITVSGDMYNGDPLVAVLVDGKQIGTYDITAHHSLGQTQTIALPGSFDATAGHTVQVQFLNDDWDGIPNADGHDRNAYVEAVTINGVTVSGQNFASNNAALGQGSLDPNAAVLLTSGTATYTVAAPPPQAQAPTLAVQAASGMQGNAIALSISAAQAAANLAAADLSITVSGLNGATLNHGTHNADGSYTLHLSDLQGLSLTPASGFTGALSLHVVATDTEATSTASSATQTLGVTVNAPPVAPPPVSAPSGSGGSLSLVVSGDMYNGDPHIAVLVDGKQVGTYDVSAHHSLGQTQTINVTGTFDPSLAHQVQVQFLNDGWDGSSGDGHDRNVYVESATLNGNTIQGQNFTSDNASMGYDRVDPHAAVMVANGTTAYNFAPAASGLSLKVAGDMYSGDPQIAVLVDGKQVGTYDISAHHSLGQVQTINVAGSFDPSVAHQVQVQFLNDAWDGTPNVDGHDRNAYVESVSLNGTTVQGQAFASNNASMGQDSQDPHAAVMLANGTASYSIASTEPTLAPTTTSGTHDMFTFTSLSQAGGQIASFNPADDALNLTQLLKAVGYSGHNPLGDHIVDLAANANGGTAVMIDPTGHDLSHATVLVTLDHILPQSLTAADILHA